MVIGRHKVNFPAVIVENIDGATLAVQHLIDMGHNRIGFIGGSKNSTTASDRLTGYKSALAQNGYLFDERLVRYGNLTPKCGYRETKSLLVEKKRPTAIFAANDQMAFGAIYAAKELGLEIPYDLAVIGFDNISFSSYFVPPLSTIEIPMYSLGAKAMQMLVNLISKKRIPRTKIFKTKLIVRESTINSRDNI